MSSKNNPLLNLNPELERAIYNWPDKDVFVSFLRDCESNAFNSAYGSLGEVANRHLGAAATIRTIIQLFADADLKPYVPPEPPKQDTGLEGTY